MANLSLKGKNRSFNTPVPKIMDGDASKENWRDKEVQEDIKKRNLFELFPRHFIEQSQVEMIDYLLDQFNEPTYDRSIIVTRWIQVAELKTGSGIIMAPNGDFDGKFGGKHGQALEEKKWPSKISVVLSVGKNVTEKPERGDIVRFFPWSAQEIPFGIHHVVVINESHLQTCAGHYKKPEKIAAKKKVSK